MADEIRAYDPTVRERMASSLQGGLEGVGIRRQIARRGAQTVMGGESSALPFGVGVADFAPFVGTAMGLEEGARGLGSAAEAVKRGDYINAAAETAGAAAGLIPGGFSTYKAGKNMLKKLKTIDLPKPKPIETESVPKKKQSLKEWAMAGGGVPESHKDRADVWHKKAQRYAAGGEVFNTVPDMADGGDIIQGPAYAKGGAVKQFVKGALEGAQKILAPAERDANKAKFLEQSKTPMVLYHGTTASEGGKGAEAIRRIKPSKEGALGSGVYLTPSSAHASGYSGVPNDEALEMMLRNPLHQDVGIKALNQRNSGNVLPSQEGGNMLPVYAQIKKPLELHMERRGQDPMVLALTKLGMDEGKATRMVEKAYEDKGYIGKQVQQRAQAQGYDGLMQYRDGDLSEVVSYNPNAVKSSIGNRGTYDVTSPELNEAHGGVVHAAGGGAMKKMIKGALTSVTEGVQKVLPLAERDANTAKMLEGSKAKVAEKAALKIKPPSDNIRTVRESNFMHSRLVGNQNVKIGDLSGGVRLSDPQERQRVKDLADKISSPDGYISRIIVDQDNNVIEGQHRLEALRQLGVQDVPVYKIEDLEATMPVDKMKSAMSAVGPIHSDHVNQLVDHALEHISEGGINSARQMNYGKFQKHYDAALDAAVGMQKVLPAAERDANLAKFMEGSVAPKLYHGTGRDIQEFDKSKLRRTAFGEGFHLAESPNLANFYANQFDEGQNVMPVHAAIKKPYELKNMHDWYDIPGNNDKEKTNFLKSQGYDGIKYPHGAGGDPTSPSPNVYVAFEPEQIKSATGNRGTYDTNEPDLNKAAGGAIHMTKGGAAIKAALAKLGKFATESDLNSIKEAGRVAYDRDALTRATKDAEIKEKLKSMPARSKAANIEMGMYHPVGGGLKLSKPFEAMHSTRVKNPKVGTPDVKILTPEDLYREEAAFFPLVGDKADTGTFLTHIGENELEVPVGLGGGPRYMDVNYNIENPKQSAAWESGTGRTTALGRQAERAGEGGRPVYGMYTAGSGTNTDFNIMGANAALQQIPSSKITKKTEKAFDAEMRSIYPDWPGLKSEAVSDLLMDKSQGELRKNFLNLMGSEPYQKAGFPDVPATRKAITDPQLLETPTNEAGFRIARMDPTGRIIEDPLHPSDYPTAMAGELEGQLNMGMDYKDMFSTHFDNRRLLGQPESGDYYSFSRAHPIQYADQEWLDKIMKAQEAKNKLIKTGKYAKGGLAAVKRETATK